MLDGISSVQAITSGDASEMLRFVTNPLLVVGPFEDWSQVRSPGRARRRRARGHPQRICIYYRPDPSLWICANGVVVGHPDTVAHALKAIEEKANEGARRG